MPEVERRRCPQEFQDRIDRAVGKNKFGGPLWKIAWGQTETFIAGGFYQQDRFLGYRPLMLSNGNPVGKGTPCWMVLEWHPAEDYGTPAGYYFHHRDELTGLQMLGEYPYKGRYEVAFKLTNTELRNGRLELIHYQLVGYVLDWLIPKLVQGQRMKHVERMAVARKQDEDDEKQFDNNVEAALKNAKETDYGGNRTQRVLDRELLMRKQMSTFLKEKGTPRAGMHQGSFV